MAREHIYLSVCKVVVIPAPHSIEGEEGINNPALLEVMRVTDTDTRHHTKATTKALLEGDELTATKEEWACEVKRLHTGVGADINNDADWNDFQKQLEELGLAEYQKYVQTAYDRQK